MSFEHLSWASRTDVGQKRKNNEDSHVCVPDHGVFCVADGMGGMSAGDMASNIVVTTVREQFEAETGLHSAASKAGRAISTLRLANERVRLAAKNRGLHSVGSTVVLMAFDGREPAKLAIVHAGDSRAYRFRGRQLLQLTTDHSVAEAVGVDEKKLSAMFRGVVTRAIGTVEEIEPERTNLESQPGDVYLICSDGLTRMVADQGIAQILLQREHEPLQQRADALVAAANEAGGDDNVTVILIQVSAWNASTSVSSVSDTHPEATAVDGDTSTSTSPGDETSETADEVSPKPGLSAAATVPGDRPPSQAMLKTAAPPQPSSAPMHTPPPSQAREKLSSQAHEKLPSQAHEKTPAPSGQHTKTRVLPEMQSAQALPSEISARKSSKNLMLFVAIFAAVAAIIGGGIYYFKFMNRSGPDPVIPWETGERPEAVVVSNAAAPIAEAEGTTTAVTQVAPASATGAKPLFVLVDENRNFAVIVPGPPRVTHVPAKNGAWGIVKENREAFNEWWMNTPAAAEAVRHVDGWLTLWEEFNRPKSAVAREAVFMARLQGLQKLAAVLPDTPMPSQPPTIEGADMMCKIYGIHHSFVVAGLRRFKEQAAEALTFPNVEDDNRRMKEIEDFSGRKMSMEQRKLIMLIAGEAKVLRTSRLQQDAEIATPAWDVASVDAFANNAADWQKNSLDCGRALASFLQGEVGLPPAAAGGQIVASAEFLAPIAKSQEAWVATLRKVDGVNQPAVSLDAVVGELVMTLQKKDKTAVEAIEHLRGLIFTIHRAHELRARAGAGGKT